MRCFLRLGGALRGWQRNAPRALLVDVVGDAWAHVAGEDAGLRDRVAINRVYALVTALYGLWRVWRLGRRFDRLAYGGFVVAGVVLGAALSAVGYSPRKRLCMLQKRRSPPPRRRSTGFGNLSSLPASSILKLPSIPQNRKAQPNTQ